jgi:aminoglycoside phosphotransferase (APT) family kinase protein
MLEDRHAAAIAERFALGEATGLIGPIARGELGWAWQLTTVTGIWAVKVPIRPKPEHEAREEADVQDAARTAGISAPEVKRTVEGRVLAELDGTQVRVSRWVDVLERDPLLDPADVGDLIASIHRARLPDLRPQDPWYRDPVGAERWDGLVRSLRSARAPFAEDLAAYRDELVALQELLEPPSSVQTCHRDLWADNVRGTVEGPLCVLDWEDFGLADPSQELCLVLFEFGAGDPGRARAIYEAYVAAGGPGRVDRLGTFAMLIAQLSHIGEAGCAQWLAAGPSTPEREHAATWVGEFLSEPLTRDAIGRILGALS